MNKLYAALIISFSLALSGCGDGQRSGQSAPPLVVGVYTVESKAIPLSTTLPGRTIAYRTAEVRPQVNGIVLKRTFEEGSMVTAGQDLYQIDPDIYKANYDRELALVEKLGRTAERQKSLKDQKSVSDQDYEDAHYAWEQAKANMELTRLNLAYSQIKAPVAGRIGKSTITEGALVTNGQAQAMAVINQIDPMFVDLTPSMNQLLQIERTFSTDQEKPAFLQDTDVQLTLEDGSIYALPGKMKFLDNEVNQGTGTVTLRAEFPNPKSQLLPGMYVRAQVQEGILPEGMVIPQQALIRDMKGNPQVWVVGPDNVIQLKSIKADRTLGNTWLVTEGLEPGDRGITEGLHQRLANGMVVSPKAAENVDIKLAYNG